MKRFLKKTGIWIGIIILALLLFGFLLPREINVSRSITVAAPIDRVFEQVNDLRNWEKWSPWKRMDPTMVMTFSNPPVGQNAFYVWETQDKHMGNGKLTLTKLVSDPLEDINAVINGVRWVMKDGRVVVDKLTEAK